MGYPRDFCQRPRTDNIYKRVEKSQSDFEQRLRVSSISDEYKQIGRSQTELVLNTVASPWEQKPSCGRAPSFADQKKNVPVTLELQEVLKQQQEAMQLMADSIQMGFGMPKRELLTFDGDPLNYWLLVNNFEVNVAKRVKDAETKLAYLFQRCTGKAKEAITNCSIISNAEKGYEKAQEILYQRFGQKHVLAHAHISKLSW